MAKTKVELQNYQGESLSPITIASNVLYEDGRNAQEVFEEYSNETFTPTIENSSSMFKVGQGDNVDYSSNVVNGAYESMVLKGKTMVNCIQEPSGKDVVLPYEFEEGRYVTINDTKESGALGVELKGQTLVNLVKGENKVYTLNVDGTYKLIHINLNTALEINKKYYLSYRVITNTIAEGNFGLFVTNGSDHCGVHGQAKRNETGTMTYVGDVNKVADKLRVFAEPNCVSGTFEVTDVMLIEYQKGMENLDIPYFTGMTSCKMPILTTTGKNLFDINQTVDGYFGGNGNINQPDFNNKVSNYIKVKPNTVYIYSFDGFSKSDVGGIYWTGWFYYNSQKEIIGSRQVNSGGNESNKKITFTTPSDCNYIRIGSRGLALNDVAVQLELGSSATTYEPYKSSILSLPEEVVLRSLPNGVCDTFNTRTGVYTQRIGELTLNGEESWAISSASSSREDTAIFDLNVPNAKIIGNSVVSTISDKFKTIPNKAWREELGEWVNKTPNNHIIAFSIFRSKLSSVDVNGFKAWLQLNPTKVQYELEAPIITKINLSSTLKSWNTTTHIYSEIPENTLYPILSHSNPTYPVILKPSTKYSIVANSYSNDHTNSAINFNLGGATASTTVGNRVTTITTPSTLTSEELVMSGRGNKLNNVMVIEGEVVGDEPYFEGICDCKSPILSNVGKNLVDSSKIRKWRDRDTHFEYPDWIRVKPNTRYITNLEMGCWELFNADKKKIGENLAPEASPNIRGKLMPSDCYYVKARCWGENTDTDNGLEYYQKNFVLCEETVITSQEPYKSNTTTFDQKDGKTIVLRSLPNGVCDTLNVETGEYVQRIGDCVLNGTESWVLDGYTTNANLSNENLCFYTRTIENVVTSGAYWNSAGGCISNRLPSYGYDYLTGKSGNPEGISAVDGRIGISVNKTLLETYDEAGVKRWLTQNPIAVQYEFATPIVSTIDVQGFPYAYTSGHVQLSSGHSGQSLTPKVEYSVATNRNGQIRSNQKMVERHQKQLDQLQAIILANMVNTQYQQTLTTLNYDLLKKEVGEQYDLPNQRKRKKRVDS